MQRDGTARPMGRPRDERVDRAILEATLELIAERGVHGFRTEDVAVRAAVGKGAIYRRYPSKDELVTAAVAALSSTRRSSAPGYGLHPRRSAGADARGGRALSRRRCRGG